MNFGRNGLVHQALTAVVAELRKDWAVYAIVLSYGVLVASVAWYLDALDKLQFLSRWTRFLEYPARVSALILVYLCLVSMWQSPCSPASECLRRVRSIVSPRFIAGCITLSTLALFLGMFSTAKNLMPLFSAFLDNERQLADLDGLIHGQAVWQYFQPFLDFLHARRVIEIVYGPVWFLMVSGLPFLMVVMTQFESVRRPFIVTWLLCWILLGNVAAAYFMSAGPAFYGHVTGDFTRFGALVEHLASTSGLNGSAYDMQSLLWTAHVNKISHLGTGISAFPSVHVSMATLSYLIARRGPEWLRVIGTIFLVLIFVGSVYLGWHYAVDGYFSIAATVIIWKSVSWAYGDRSVAAANFQRPAVRP